jgi:hypothetical protein
MSKKKSLWEEKAREIKQTTEKLGHPIENGIKDVVIALNLVGLPTSASCEGHHNWGLGAPWVEIAASKRPKWRFVGERESFERVAKEHGIPLQQLRRGKPPELRKKAYLESSTEETPQYKEWRKANQELLEKAEALLREFYRNRKVPLRRKLQISKLGEGHFRIHNGGSDYCSAWKLAPEEQAELEKRLPEYRAEMRRFAEFLRERYIQGGKE